MVQFVPQRIPESQSSRDTPTPPYPLGVPVITVTEAPRRQRENLTDVRIVQQQLPDSGNGALNRNSSRLWFHNC